MGLRRGELWVGGAEGGEWWVGGAEERGVVGSGADPTNDAPA